MSRWSTSFALAAVLNPYPKSSGPHEQAIRNWVKQDDLNNGRREDGLTTEERSELRRLRRENKKLKMEQEILAKAAAWFAREDRDPAPSLLVHRGKHQAFYRVRRMCCLLDVSPQRLLRLA